MSVNKSKLDSIELRKLRRDNVELKRDNDQLCAALEGALAKLDDFLQRAHQAEHELRAVQREYNLVFDELQARRRLDAARDIAGAIEEQ